MDFTEVMKMTSETMKASMEMTQQNVETTQTLFSNLAGFLTQFFGVLAILIIAFFVYKAISNLFRR